jgi:hypothetical protein
MGPAGHVLTGLLYFFDPSPAIRRTAEARLMDRCPCDRDKAGQFARGCS